MNHEVEKDPSEDTIIGKDPCVTPDDLKKKFPKVFSQPCELSIGNGWVPLMERLCYLLQRTRDCNEHMGYTQVVAAQVKEKFAGLRFYYTTEKQVHLNDNTKWSDWDSYVRGAVDFAESMSYKTCEWCGQPGKVRNKQGYYFTSCDKHDHNK
jgi:hypothetical protein